MKCFFSIFMVLFFLSGTVNFAFSVSKEQSALTASQEKELIVKLSMADAYYAAGDEGFAKAAYEQARSLKNNSYSLFCNELASLALNQDHKEEAKGDLLDAYYGMNNASFPDLEKQALSFIKSENKKYYQGDPYEKIMNAVYLGLLFYDEGNYDNALACMKTAILADSDVQKEDYQSDFALSYVLAARIEKLRGRDDAADNYLQGAIKAYRLSYPSLRDYPDREEEIEQKIKDLEDTLDRYKNTSLSGQSTQQRFENYNQQWQQARNDLKALQAQREADADRLDVRALKQVADLRNNVLICVNMGRGPVKFATGRYGEIVKFAEGETFSSPLSVLVDGRSISQDRQLRYNDISFQASTRGGRKMDKILNNKVVFKDSTRDLGNRVDNLADRYSKDGNSKAALVAQLMGLAFKVTSSMANPSADIRNWSLLPAEVRLIALELSPGEHSIQISCADKTINKTIQVSEKPLVEFVKL